MNVFISLISGAIVGVCVYFAIRPAAWHIVAMGKSLSQIKQILIATYMIAVYSLSIVFLAYAIGQITNSQKNVIHIAIGSYLIALMIPYGRFLYIYKIKKRPNHTIKADEK